jgi:poly-gamma-glutamate synthesis protein (capsule biosynthesis protein)
VEPDSSTVAAIAIAGDWAPLDATLSSLVADPIRFYGDLGSMLSTCNLRIVNLEGVVSDSPGNPIAKDGEHILLPRSALEDARCFPFDAACLANNHIGDFGTLGLSDTLEWLRLREVEPIGVTAGSVSAQCSISALTRTFGNLVVGVINVCEPEESADLTGPYRINTMDQPDLRDSIDRLRPRCDVILAIVHAGREYLPTPAPHIRKKYRSLIDSGVDIVVGHHPHVPQGIESYCGGIIFYSIGNFVFTMGSENTLLRTGILIVVNIANANTIRVMIEPYVLDECGVHSMKVDERKTFFQTLKRLSDIAAEPSASRDIWEAFADRWLVVHGIEELVEYATTLATARDVIRGSLLPVARRCERSSWDHRIARKAVWSMLGVVRPRKHDAYRAWPKYAGQRRHSASILRNRFATETHRELNLTALERLISGKVGSASPWAYDFVEEYCHV